MTGRRFILRSLSSSNFFIQARFFQYIFFKFLLFMLRKVMKWTLIVISVLLIVIVGVFYTLTTIAGRQMQKKYQVEPEVIMIPSDSASLERGRQRASVLCMDCHGDGFAGKEFFNDPKLGRLDAPNLTAGRGGIGGVYSDGDWIRAIRHGVNREGRALMVMPAKDFHSMSEQDLSEVVAYIKTIPPADHEIQAKPEFTAFAKALMAAGAFGTVFSADEIDHSEGFAVAPEAGPTAVYGDYLVKVFGCRHCHGEILNGGKSPDPASPVAPNITPGGNLGKWSEAQFASALRSGLTPEGRQLTDYMPWKATAHMADADLTAVYKYLHSLPKLETAKK
jgi:mono/diheme cytochrome c family protein